MNHNRAFKIFNLLAFVLFATTLIATQTNVGLIQGSVTDRFGAVIPNAKIKAILKDAKGPETGRETKSNDDGGFSFSKLPYGIYELEVAVNWTENTFKKRVEVNSQTPILANIVFSLGSCTGDDTKNETYSITDGDRAAIIRQMLNLFLEKHFGILMKHQAKSGFILSTKNIKPEWLDLEQKSKFILLLPAEIQDRADKTIDFPFFSVSEFNVKGRCVEVAFDNIWAIGKKSGLAYLSGGGVFYAFRKVNGHWEGKFIDEWVS